MTVSSTTSRVSYNGNNSTTVFSVPFYFLANADLVVYVGGVLKVINTDYTVSGAGVPAGGSVTFTSAPPSGTGNVVIFRSPSATQELDYIENDDFPAESHERGLDKLTMLVQRLSDRVDRTIRFSDFDTATSGGVLPTPATRASKYLTFDVDGNPSVSGQNIDELVAAAAASAQAAENSADAAAASEAAAAISEQNAADSETAAGLSAATAQAAIATITTAANALAPTITTYSGTGAQVNFTLPYAVSNEALIDVYIAGVYQQASEYSVAGTTLTFTAAPPLGTNNIEVKTAANVTYTLPASLDYGLVTESATSSEDYGALV